MDIKRKKSRIGRGLPVGAELVLTIAFDVIFLAALLNVFALFHHVIPRKKVAVGTEIVRPADTFTTDENGMWGNKFADKFLEKGEVVRTADSYRSHDVYVTVTKEQRSGAVYFVADIYIRNIDNFRTAFAQDEYGKSISESVVAMAKRNQAIIATNGDYYGIRDHGVCIKNGVVYRTEPFADVCALYYDGTLRTFKRRDFSMSDAVRDGVYQAWSFGPELLHNGETVSEFSWSIQSENPRCAIGYYEPGHYCLVVIDGRKKGYSEGMTFQEMSKMFYEMGCRAAYNMDGGQSAQMVFLGALVNRPAAGGRDTSDIIYIGETDTVSE